MKSSVLFSQDLLFQFRSGIHPVYLGVSAFYILILKLLPDAWMVKVFPAVVLTDPSLMGFLFIGALLFFERDQGIFPLLSVSPVKITEYIFSKTVTLSMTAIGSTMLIGLFVVGTGINYILLLTGTALTSALFTMAGIAIALKFKNVGSFLVLSGGIDIPIVLPLISVFNIWDSPFLFILPTRGTLVFLEGAMGTPQPPSNWIMGTATLLIWTAAAGFGAVKSLEKEFILLPGEAE